MPDPDKIVCIGLNYRSHAEEAGVEPPEVPTFFAKFPNALAATGAEVKLPAASDKVDYEAEVAFVVGRRCKRRLGRRGAGAIAGYMLLNDLSARDLQFATPQWMPGKVFDGSAPCGPALVTPDEAGAHDAISFQLELNGERMQDAVDLGPDLLAPGASLAAVGLDDDGARGHRLHGHTVRRRQRARAAGLAEAGGRDRDQLAHPGAPADEADERLRVSGGMREDPIISGGLFKLLLVLLVAAGLGVGAFAIAGDGVDIDLPDLPEVDTGEVTDLDNTTLNDTTIGEEPEQPAGEPVDAFTSAGFATALETVRGAAGADAELTRMFINGTQTQFIVRRGGDEVEAYSVRADSGELVREDATISISGNATLDDFSFPLDGVKASAIDRMLAAARKQSGADDFEPTVLTLERAIPFGSRELRWTINAEGGGRNLLYRAAPDGSDVRNEGGEGSEIPQAAQDAKKLNECIPAAKR